MKRPPRSSARCRRTKLPTEEVHCSLYVEGSDPLEPCTWSFVGTSREAAMKVLIHHQRERHSLDPSELEQRVLRPYDPNA